MIYNSGGKKTDSYNGKLEYDQAKGRILGRDEDFLARLLILADGRTFRMKISEEGKDVFTADDDEIIFDSDNKLFKIVGRDDGSAVAPGVTTVADGTNTFSGFAQNDYPHGLDFAPLVIAWVERSPGEYVLMPYSEVVSANAPQGGLQSSIFRISANETNVSIFSYLVTYSPGIGATTTTDTNVIYYLLAETAPS